MRGKVWLMSSQQHWKPWKQRADSWFSSPKSDYVHVTSGHIATYIFLPLSVFVFFCFLFYFRYVLQGPLLYWKFTKTILIILFNHISGIPSTTTFENSNRQKRFLILLSLRFVFCTWGIWSYVENNGELGMFTSRCREKIHILKQISKVKLYFSYGVGFVGDWSYAAPKLP